MRFAYLLPLALLSPLAMAGHCQVPKGEVDYLESRLYPSQQSGTQGGYTTVPYKTYIEPSKDCSSVKVWATMSAKAAKVPTDDQCAHLRDSDLTVPFGGLVSCTSFKVYPSEDAAQGVKDSVAYMKDGSLVTHAGSPYGGTFSAVYLYNEGSKKVVGVTQFTQNYAAYPPGTAGIIGYTGGYVIGGYGALGVTTQDGKPVAPAGNSGGNVFGASIYGGGSISGGYGGANAAPAPQAK